MMLMADPAHRHYMTECGLRTVGQQLQFEAEVKKLSCPGATYIPDLTEWKHPCLQELPISEGADKAA